MRRGSNLRSRSNTSWQKGRITRCSSFQECWMRACKTRSIRSRWRGMRQHKPSESCPHCASTTSRRTSSKSKSTGSGRCSGSTVGCSWTSGLPTQLWLLVMRRLTESPQPPPHHQLEHIKRIRLVQLTLYKKCNRKMISARASETAYRGPMKSMKPSWRPWVRHAWQTHLMNDWANSLNLKVIIKGERGWGHWAYIEVRVVTMAMTADKGHKRQFAIIKENKISRWIR